MIHIAIVEDDPQEQKRLLQYLNQYAQENAIAFQFTIYSEALSFFDERKSFDIIFMDIMMPHINGMEAAINLRKYDRRVVLFFVTTMAQFAVKGYEVEALDYILKPVTYNRLTMKLSKAIEIIHADEGATHVINDVNAMVKCSTNDILYVEVSGHKLAYHTKTAVFTEHGSLNKLEDELASHSFFRCNACYLVNPRHIVQVNHKELTVIMSNGDELKISQPRRKAFIADLTEWLGQGKR